MLICLLQLLVERIGGALSTLRRAIHGPEQLLQVVDPFGILHQGLVFASLHQDLFDLQPGSVDQLQEPRRGVPIDEGLDAVVQVHEGLAILGEGELREQVQGDSCRLPAEYALALGRLPVVTPEAADILEQHRPTEGVPLGDGGQVAPTKEPLQRPNPHRRIFGRLHPQIFVVVIPAEDVGQGVRHGHPQQLQAPAVGQDSDHGGALGY